MENENKLPPEFKAKWIAALRSGEYKQGQSSLYNPSDDTYCCMGVIGVMLGVDKVSMSNKAYFDSKPIDTRIEIPDGLPTIFDGSDINSACHMFARMNDIEGKSFSEIADFIEENL